MAYYTTSRRSIVIDEIEMVKQILVKQKNLNKFFDVVRGSQDVMDLRDALMSAWLTHCAKEVFFESSLADDVLLQVDDKTFMLLASREHVESREVEEVAV
jgi:hypothetical protein